MASARVQSIAVIDDHPAVFAGIALAVQRVPTLRLAVTAATVDAMLDQCQRSSCSPALVILDLRLADGSTPGGNTRRLLAAGHTVLAYTAADSPDLVREAARAGVCGVLRKSESLQTLREAITQALAGDVVASMEWAAALDSPDIATAGLTRREEDVLELYASGEKAGRVAHLLGISRDTVLVHIRNIRHKYAAVDRPARTKVDLFRRAVEDGVIAADAQFTP